MIRPRYVSALVFASLLAATTARAGNCNDCLRRIGLGYGAGYHSAAPAPGACSNHFHWKTICAWPGAATLGGRCGCEPCPTPCCEPCAAPCRAPLFRAAPGGTYGTRPPAGIY